MVSVRAPSTCRTYAREWSRFARWCSARALLARPARGEIVALYLVELTRRGRAVSTVERSLRAIGDAHVRAGLPSPREAPAVRDVFASLRRSAPVESGALFRAALARPGSTAAWSANA